MHIFRSLLSKLRPGTDRIRYIFIISAMRSGSTLLQHLVGQQRHILSAGETKIEYLSRDDLKKLEDHLYGYNRIDPKSRRDARICLEKCVHDRYFPDPTPIEASDTRFLLILRDPIPALSSLLEQDGWPYTESIDAAAWYFRERTKSVQKFAEALREKRRMHFIRYEDLLRDPAPHLAAMTRFLQLKEPLKPEYPKQKWTGKLSLGDVSQTIKEAKIVPNSRSRMAPLPEGLRAELSATHAEAVRRLTSFNQVAG